jgi:hypothetical protein
MGGGRIFLKSLRNSSFNNDLSVMSVISAGSISLDSTRTFKKRGQEGYQWIGLAFLHNRRGFLKIHSKSYFSHALNLKKLFTAFRT